MNTKKLWLLAIAWFSLLTLAGCASTPSQTQELSKQDTSAQVLEMVEPVDQVETVEQETNMQAWIYADYSPAAVQDALNNGKKVALFFHASRCPSCRSLDKDIKADIDELPENTVVFKVDYDGSSDLKEKYAVTTQHTTVIIDANMNLVQKDTWTRMERLISLLQ